MSAGRLRDAAILLRERAAGALNGPWISSIEGRDHFGGDDVILTQNHDLYVSGGVRTQDYITTMHPPVALALADWLDHEAEYEDRFPDLTGSPTEALAVADAILGSES